MNDSITLDVERYGIARIEFDVNGMKKEKTSFPSEAVFSLTI